MNPNAKFAKLAAMKRALSKKPMPNPAEEAAESPDEERAELVPQSGRPF